ncbi:MAG: hypothetical protein LBI29_03325 [Rickettsiales bacterium]|jgi:hypothetical protein|nr:hypothetical protein [Rickettsiales bacterium]
MDNAGREEDKLLEKEIEKIQTIEAEIKKKKTEIKKLLVKKEKKRETREQLKKKIYDSIDKNNRTQLRFIGFLRKKFRSQTNDEVRLLKEDKEIDRKIADKRKLIDQLLEQTLEYKIKECDIAMQSVRMAILICKSPVTTIVKKVATAAASGGFKETIGRLLPNIVTNFVGDVIIKGLADVVESLLLSVVTVVVGGVSGGIANAKNENKNNKVFSTRDKFFGFVRGIVSGIKSVFRSIFIIKSTDKNSDKPITRKEKIFGFLKKIGYTLKSIFSKDGIQKNLSEATDRLTDERKKLERMAKIINSKKKAQKIRKNSKLNRTMVQKEREKVFKEEQIEENIIDRVGTPDTKRSSSSGKKHNNQKTALSPESGRSLANKVRLVYSLSGAAGDLEQKERELNQSSTEKFGELSKELDNSLHMEDNSIKK